MFFLRFSVLLLFLLTFSLLYSPMFSSIFFFYFFVSHLSNCPLFLSLYSLSVLFPCFFCPSSLVFFFSLVSKTITPFQTVPCFLPYVLSNYVVPFLSMSHFYNLFSFFLFLLPKTFVSRLYLCQNSPLYF